MIDVPEKIWVGNAGPDLGDTWSDEPQEGWIEYIRADITYEIVAKWHDKNARLCLEASKDDPRLNADDRRRAYEAGRHHAASAASLRSIVIERHRQKIGGEK